MSANVDERMSLRACEGGARGCDPSSPARGEVTPESAGQISIADLMEAERVIYGFIKKVGLKPEDYSRIEQDLRNGKITIYGHTYRLANSSEEIQKILDLPWDAPIKVKASVTGDKVRLDVYSIDEVFEQKGCRREETAGTFAGINT